MRSAKEAWFLDATLRATSNSVGFVSGSTITVVDLRRARWSVTCLKLSSLASSRASRSSVLFLCSSTMFLRLGEDGVTVANPSTRRLMMLGPLEPPAAAPNVEEIIQCKL